MPTPPVTFGVRVLILLLPAANGTSANLQATVRITTSKVRMRVSRFFVGFDVHATFVLALERRQVCLDRSATLQNKPPQSLGVSNVSVQGHSSMQGRVSMQGRLEWKEGSVHFILETYHKPEKKNRQRRRRI